MATKMIDPNGNVIEGVLRWIFVCDRCGNTAPFKNGMESFSIPEDESEIGKSYCSTICVMAVLEGKGKVVNV